MESWPLIKTARAYHQKQKCNKPVTRAPIGIITKNTPEP